MFDTYTRYLCDRLKSSCAEPKVSLHDLVSMFAIVAEYFAATTRVNPTVEEFLNKGAQRSWQSSHRQMPTRMTGEDLI